MLKKELKIFSSGVIVATIALVFVASNFSITSSTTTSTSEEEGSTLTYKAVQCTYIKRAGETEWTKWDCNPNIFNSEGKNFTMRQISGPIDGNGTTSTGLVRVIAVANVSGGGNCGAQTPADVFLCGEYNTCGLSRASANNVGTNTSTAPTAGNWTISREFTATGTCEVNGTGLFNTTTANDTAEIFFAQNTFTTATLNNNDKINVTWFIWVV